MATDVNGIEFLDGQPIATSDVKTGDVLSFANGEWINVPIADLESAPVDLSNYTTLQTIQTITGLKTFQLSPIVPTVDAADDSTKAASTGFVKNQGYLTSAQFKTLNGVSIVGVGNITAESIITAGDVGQYYRGDKTWQTLNKATVGLSDVDNTSDTSKPVSTATQTALNGKSDTGHTHIIANVTGLQTALDGKQAAGSYSLTSHTHQDATTSVAGFMQTTDKSKLDGIAQGATNYTHPVNHPASIITQDSSNRFVTDAEKTTWNDKQSALGFTPENAANKGAANGYASLDAGGKVPTAQLPAYVDDVLEFSNLVSFPGTGEEGKIYVALDTNKTYRWGGSSYTYITSGAVDSVAGKTGVVTLVKGDVGLGNVDNTADTAKPVSTAQQTALNAKENTIAVGSTAQYYRGDKSWQTLDKTAVGLSSADNTSDANKPVSTAQQTAINGRQPLDADLTAIAALVGTSGLLRKTAADTWSLDTAAYVTSSGVTAVSGTAPIVSSGGVTPAISISAATTSAAGSMSAADKTKLDGIASGATANTGTVTSVGGTGAVSGLTLTGAVTTTGNLTLGGTLAVTPTNFASQAANAVLIAPNGAAGVPTFRTLLATDIPTLNQNTTGQSASISVPDNRAVNDQPQGKLGYSITADFKDNAAVDSPPVTSTANYSHIMTVAGWNQAGGGGGWPTQVSFGDGLAIRQGTSATTWGSWRTLLHSNNFNSYVPTLTGTGASGTWTININGNAATADTASSANNIDGIPFYNGNSTNGISPDAQVNNGIAYATSVSLLGVIDGALYQQAYSAQWIHQIFGDYRTGQIVVRGKNNGAWMDWRTVWDSGNLTNLNQLTNGPGYTTNTGTVTSVSGTGAVSGLTLTGAVTSTGNLTLGGTLSAQIQNISDLSRIFNNSGETHPTRSAFDATSPQYGFGWRFIQGATNGPGTSGEQFYSLYVGLGNEYAATGGGSYGMQIAIDRNVTNPYLSVRYNEANSLSTWKKIHAGYADTAGNVTGTIAVANGGTGSTAAAGARTNLGATTVGANFFTLTDPGAITFPRINADNTVSALSAADFRTAIGAGTAGAEADTLATVTARGGTTSTAVQLLNHDNHFSGHIYYNSHDANGNHYPQFLDGANGTGAVINWRLFTGPGQIGALHQWTTALATFGTNTQVNGTFRNVLASGQAGDTLLGAISGVSNGYQISNDTSNNITYKWHGSDGLWAEMQGGKLSIGTAIANAALSVSRGVGVSGFVEIAGNGQTSAAMLLGQDSGGAAYCWQRANGFLLFGTNNTERARIAADGKVSIATTTAHAPLTVRTTHANPLSTSYKGAINIHDEPNGVSPHLELGVAYNGGSQYSWLQQNSTGGVYPLCLNVAGGNVGINTPTPAYTLEVNGSFAATTKSFVIDHPTKEGKKLRYGSLEGPENGVYVRGKQTDRSIELPEYWTKLVDPNSITVQLTAIGKPHQLWVVDIKDNTVYIDSDSEEINCFYYILAERVDVGKLQVEID